MKARLHLNHRPLIVAIAGPNGAGKTTFYHTFISSAALRYISADDLARELNLEVYQAANAADALRKQFIAQRESFAFETVFSDPVGDKLSLLKDAVSSGYSVVLFFIGLENSTLSEERVAMRVSKGGHDVPTEKLQSRFPRTLANLQKAIRNLPLVYIYDNSDLNHTFQKIAVFKDGHLIERATK